ncbi:unnamed protein product [Schistosoma mattheei]|uniref:Uncharacterized protein n=1 Tax=Schistosoma mattheei TaxID=31246 RepID=A0A183NVF3_9TREM|nr:unnamed protein product [Schistosoma mattheei]
MFELCPSLEVYSVHGLIAHFMSIPKNWIFEF